MSRKPMILATLPVIVCGVSFAAPLGTSITYQGQLKSAGQPANGTFNLVFTLWDAPGVGTPPVGGVQIGGADSEPSTTVTNGLFTVQLNDTGQFGSSAFTGSARYLQISVNGTPLGPRQPMNAAPYALYALAAPSGTITLPFSGSFSGSDQNAMTITQTGLGSAARFVNSSASNYYEALSIGTNGTGPAVYATHSGTGYVGQFQNLNASNSLPAVLAITNGSGACLYGNASVGSNATGVIGNGHGTGDGVRASVDGSGNAIQAVCSGTGRAGYFQNTNTSSALSTLRVDSVSTNSGVASVAGVNTGNGYAGYFEVNNTSNSQIGLYSVSNGTGPALRIRNNSGSTYRLIDFNGTSINSDSNAIPFGSPLNLNNTSNSNISLCQGGGNVGVGTAGGVLVAAKLQVDGGGDVSLTGTGNHLTLGSTTSLNLAFDNNELMARNNGAASTLYLNHDGGDVRIGQGAGASTVYVKVLAITGADVAEKFPTTEKDSKVEPGTVMEIDPDEAGHLRIARGAYNTRVAGVVSGAGDIPVGAILGNMEGQEDSPAIALSGRVWVKCDTTTRAIRIGDRLTTSDTPGHAMRATDRDRADGAIIGKAMTSLEAGRKGLVLVIVNLQ